jgi:hypothetical protein
MQEGLVVQDSAFVPSHAINLTPNNWVYLSHQSELKRGLIFARLQTLQNLTENVRLSLAPTSESVSLIYKGAGRCGGIEELASEIKSVEFEIVSSSKNSISTNSVSLSPYPGTVVG